VDAPDAPAVRKRLQNKSRKGRPDVRLMSAGGIVYRNRAGRIEIFFIKDPFGRWSFPKGKVALGETLAETAVREIREETGLDDLKLVAPLGYTSFRFWREAGLIEKTLYMFLFKAAPNARETLTGDSAIFEGAWMPVHAAFQVSGYRNSDRLLGKAMRVIAEQEGVRTYQARAPRVPQQSQPPSRNRRSVTPPLQPKPFNNRTQRSQNFPKLTDRDDAGGKW
jgi:8-oxo-dGTP pyrophosphatase MutT (NUDIX family)